MGINLKGQEAKEYYAKNWNVHISQLKSIGWYLPNDEDRKKLNNAIKELESLIVEATNNIKTVETYP